MPNVSMSGEAAKENSSPRSVRPATWLERLDALFQERARMLVGIVLAACFFWRLWLAQATFLNTDEAWHFFLANQASSWLAYKASLTISHPPLLILILHFWRVLATSEVVLRLPGVLAGTVFCWMFYRWLDLVAGRATAWAGLIFAAFLGPMISTSAEVRQNPLLLMFAIGAAWLFELALQRDSAGAMWFSFLCLCLAMLSHYSAFFIAGALGGYGIVRVLQDRPSARVLLSWITGETAGVVLAGVLYRTHLGRLSRFLSESLLPQQYLHSSYFHRGSDHLLPFLYRGTFGVFRFIFGQTQIGQVAALLFAAGVVLAFRGKLVRSDRAKNVSLGILLLVPFVLNWLASAAGSYPYGRMRQCMFLVIFALAGVSVCLASAVKQRTALGVAAALAIVVLCHAFGTQQDRDTLPLAEQRHEHIDQALQFMRTQMVPGDIVFTDQATSFQLRHYLCRQRPVSIRPLPDGFERFDCEGFTVIITGIADGALTAKQLVSRSRDAALDRDSVTRAWVVQGGWASGLGEALQAMPGFNQIQIHSFGRYLEIFQLPGRAAASVT